MRRRIMMLLAILPLLAGIHGVLSVRGQTVIDTPIWRVQLRLAHASAAVAPEARIRVNLNARNETWISPPYQTTDLMADLLLDHVVTLGDLHHIAIEITGDSWCPERVELWVNDLRYMGQTVDCKRSEGGRRAHQIFIRRREVHTDDVHIVPNDGTQVALSVWEDIIESAVGHAIAHNGLYWSGMRAVTVTSLAPDRERVRLSLSSSPSVAVGPIVIIEWTIRRACSNGLLTLRVEDYHAMIGTLSSFGRTDAAERLAVVDFAMAQLAELVQRTAPTCK